MTKHLLTALMVIGYCSLYSQVTIDFTNPATATYSVDTMEINGTKTPAPAQYNNNGVMMMWAGDANGDGKIIYQGPGNDANTILTEVLLFDDGSGNSNSAFAYNYDQAEGYFAGDINMDGKVIYQGPGNDLNSILTSVLLFSFNTLFAYNYDGLVQQMP